jgi:hypothetical protein
MTASGFRLQAVHRYHNVQNRQKQVCKYLDTPHRKAVRPIVVVRRVHVAAVEVQVVPVAAVRRCGPIVAVAAHVVERPAIVVPIAGGRNK